MFIAIFALVLQVIGGAICGLLFTRLTGLTLGKTADAICGALGGAVGGQLFQALIPTLSDGGLSLWSALNQLAAGGASGAIATALVSLLMNPIEY